MVFSGRSVKRMKQNNRAVGTAYEQIAGRFLEKKGFQILEYNYRCRAGEIDLIAREGGYLVFVEVKYRRTADQGDPEEAVDQRKRRRIGQAAAYYLYLHGLPENTLCRFDVVALIPGKYRICKNAFELE